MEGAAHLRNGKIGAIPLPFTKDGLQIVTTRNRESSSG
jgi:hypothetical protein